MLIYYGYDKGVDWVIKNTSNNKMYKWSKSIGLGLIAI